MPAASEVGDHVDVGGDPERRTASRRSPATGGLTVGGRCRDRRSDRRARVPARLALVVDRAVAARCRSTAAPAYYADPEGEQRAAQEGWFIVLSIVAGILMAILVFFLLRRFRGSVTAAALGDRVRSLPAGSPGASGTTSVGGTRSPRPAPAKTARSSSSRSICGSRTPATSGSGTAGCRTSAATSSTSRSRRC